jgi:hypothetical protein
MNLFRRLWGNKKKDEDLKGRKASSLSTQEKARAVKIEVPKSGKFVVDIVGESYYQNNLATICGPRKRQGENRTVTAVLICDDNNPKDPMAVRVEIQNLTVGHLKRAQAREWRQALEKAHLPLVPAYCQAVIRGGWDRDDGDIGHYGVWLDLPEE